MKATTKKTTLTTEQIELQNEKMELKKLTKIIEKTPTKNEIKLTQKNEYIKEINDIDFNLSQETLALIADNLTISEELKILRKKQLNNSKFIFLNINNELISLKKSIDENKNYKYIEFTKKGIINLLRIKLNTKKMAKDLNSALNISMDYLSYNLSLNLEFVSISQIKVIINAYELCINGVNEFVKITKNRIAKAKNEASVIELMADIKQAKKVYDRNQIEAKKVSIINEYLANEAKRIA